MSVSDRFMIIAGKIGSQRHLCALRDSFAMVMPIIIAGALVTTLNNIHIMFGLETSFLPEFIKTIDGNVWWGTFNMLALFISILLGYNLGKSYDYNPPITAVIAFASYLTITPQAPPGGAWGSLAGAYTAATQYYG